MDQDAGAADHIRLSETNREGEVGTRFWRVGSPPLKCPNLPREMPVTRVGAIHPIISFARSFQGLRLDKQLIFPS